VHAQTASKRVPLGDGPWTFDTYEPKTRIKVSIVAKGLSHPYSLAFLPGGDILVTERPGRLRLIHNDVLDPKPVAGIPEVKAAELGGLLDLALSPAFGTDHLVYMTYSKAVENGVATSVARGRLDTGSSDGASLKETKDIIVTDPQGGKRVAGARLIFGRDGNLFFSVGGAGENNDMRAQYSGSDAGKIHRIRPDGSVPPDNPFVGEAGYRPTIYSMGHRNPTGFAIHPDTGVLWESEQGPQGGDEINVISPGKNYGWPIVTYGRDYDGTFMTKQPWREDFQAPLIYWVPSIANAGITFYTGDKFPAWKGNLFVAGMVEARLANTGQIQRIVLGKEGEIRRESFFRDLRQRIRDVRQSPNGYLYVLTDEDPGVVLKIEPAL
jgi:glucose/arabinose dehydrogenase